MLNIFNQGQTQIKYVKREQFASRSSPSSQKISQRIAAKINASYIQSKPEYGPIAKLRVRMRRECQERFPRHRG